MNEWPWAQMLDVTQEDILALDEKKKVQLLKPFFLT